MIDRAGVQFASITEQGSRVLIQRLLDAVELQRAILICARTRVGHSDRRYWEREVSARRDLRLLMRRTQHFWSVFSRSLRRLSSYGTEKGSCARGMASTLQYRGEQAERSSCLVGSS